MTGEESTAEDQTYTSVGYTLLGGLLVSIAVMVLGLLAVAVQGKGGTTHVYPLADVVPNVLKSKPPAILDLGILLLFATPLAGVLVALAGFIRQRDTQFTAITVVLVILLVISFGVAVR